MEDTIEEVQSCCSNCFPTTLTYSRIENANVPSEEDNEFLPLRDDEEDDSAGDGCREEEILQKTRDLVFKEKVDKLIKSLDVANGVNWIENVTLLSWEVAIFMYPVPKEDKYVKIIKCTATGSHSQNQFIRGCAFKKHAAHENMSKCLAHPALMLIRGSLDFESMDQILLMGPDRDELKMIKDVFHSAVQIADFLLDSVLKYVSDGTSTVSLPQRRLDFNSPLREELLENVRDVVSIYDNEISSYIAFALATLRNQLNKGTIDMERGVDANGKSVICKFDEEFRELRTLCCPSESDFIASLSSCKHWYVTGGNSKPPFVKTLDNRLIIKEIQKIEFDSFLKFAHNYFGYISDCYKKSDKLTCLAKVLGIYEVRVRENRKEKKHYLQVSENLWFGCTISPIYDLKGAIHGRYSVENGVGSVLLDQNFINNMKDKALYMSLRSICDLRSAVFNDTTFIKSIDVMDYSLVVGLDTDNGEVCGIIDYLRRYTLDKKLESCVKSMLLVHKNQRPTIVSPPDYVNRFRKFIKTYFLFFPENWCLPEIDGPPIKMKVLHHTIEKRRVFRTFKFHLLVHMET